MGKRGAQAGTQKREAPSSIRFDPDLKARLTAAAEQSGRSFSDEVAKRLGASFGSEVERTFGDQETYALAVLVATAAQEIRNLSGQAWHQDRWSFEQLSTATGKILEYFEPRKGDGSFPEETSPWLRELREGLPPEDVDYIKQSYTLDRTGQRVAAAVVFLMEASLQGSGGPWADKLRPIASTLKAKLISSGWDGQARADLMRFQRRSDEQ
jgi:hypothetical protein